jgi:large subunit ribosomal protein L29
VKDKGIRDLTNKELDIKLAELKTELFNLRFQHATGQLQNPHVLSECKKNIARVKTVLRDRELHAVGE